MYKESVPRLRAGTQGKHTQNSDVKAGVTGACAGQAPGQQGSQTAHVWKGHSCCQLQPAAEPRGNMGPPVCSLEEWELFKGRGNGFCSCTALGKQFRKTETPAHWPLFALMWAGEAVQEFPGDGVGDGTGHMP